MQSFKQCKRILLSFVLVLSFCFPSQFAYAEPQWEVPTTYKIIYSMLLSLGITVYYTTLDANKQSADVKDWKIDTTTGVNIAWRTVLYGLINCAEGHVRDLANQHEEGWDALQNKRLALLKTTASMVTYNTRYDEVVTQRHQEFDTALKPYVGEEYSSYFASGALFLTNVGWFYVVPMLWSPQFSTYYNRNTPNPIELARTVYVMTGSSSILALATYSISDILSRYTIISLKHTISGFFPAPGDLRFFRFPECTSCYLFTNAFGKSGLVGGQLNSLRDSIVDMCMRNESNTSSQTDL